MPNFEIGIFFSRLTYSLVNIDYNLRVFECKTAAWNMLAYHEQPLRTFDKTFLRDIPKETFDKTQWYDTPTFCSSYRAFLQRVPPCTPGSDSMGDRQYPALRQAQFRLLQEQYT